jgi:hypothetical protein
MRPGGDNRGPAVRAWSGPHARVILSVTPGQIATGREARPAHSAAAGGSTPAAVERAVGDLGRTPGGVLAFVAGSAEAAQQARETSARLAPGVPFAGLTGSGVIGAQGPLAAGCAAIAFDPRVGVGVGVAEQASLDPRGAGRSAAREALARVERDGGYRVLLLFADPDVGDQADVVAGAYEVVGGRVPLAGGAAGEPRVLMTTATHDDAVAAVALVSPLPVGVGIAHGCRTCAAPAIVTRAEGPVVQQLNGRPAEEVYLEKLGRTGRRLSDEEFESVAFAHPLAQRELSGDVRLRYVRSRGPDGALVCATTIPEYAAVEVSEETAAGVLESASTAAGAALDQLDGAVPTAALVFECASRRLVAGDELANVEVESLVALLGGPAAFAGVYTRGEIGRVRGAKGDRNHSLVVVAFA